VFLYILLKIFSEKVLIKGIKDAKKLFLVAAKFGFKFTILDLGSNFSVETIEKTSKKISPVLDLLFDEKIKIYATPGSFFATSSHNLVCNIFGKKKFQRKNEFLYYMNDGLYHSFSSTFFLKMQK